MHLLLIYYYNLIYGTLNFFFHNSYFCREDFSLQLPFSSHFLNSHNFYFYSQASIPTIHNFISKPPFPQFPFRSTASIPTIPIPAAQLLFKAIRNCGQRYICPGTAASPLRNYLSTSQLCLQILASLHRTISRQPKNLTVN